MEGYKTSRDYSRLKALLDAGRKIIVILGAQYGYSESVSFAYLVPCEGLSMYCIADDYQLAEPFTPELFASWMKDLKLEFVEPEA